MQYTTSDTGLPIADKWIARVGSVINIGSIACSPDPELWVKGFFTAAPTMFWSLFKPDPLDLVFDRAGSPHKRRRRGRGTLMEQINSSHEIKGGAQTAFFKLGQLAQRIGWYMLIADVATDFAIRWTSQVYQWAGCIPDESGPCQLSFNEIDWPLAPGEEGLPIWGTDYDPSGWSGITRIVIPAGVKAAVTYNVVSSPPVAGPPGSIYAELRNLNTGHVIDTTPPLHSDNPNYPSSWGGSFDAPVAGPGGDIYGVWVRCTGGFGNLRNSTFSAAGNLYSSILGDPL